MATVIGDRADVRMELAGRLSVVPSVAELFPYPPLALRGQSPCVSIHTDGSELDMAGVVGQVADHRFIVTLYVSRKAHGAEQAEALLDSLHREVLQVIRDDDGGVSYGEWVTDGRTRPAFVTIDGIPYRIEEIPVLARVYC